MQGSLKCFDIQMGKVVTLRTIKVIPMPDDAIKTVNRWGQGQQAITFGNKLHFLNRAKKHFDWENEELDLDDLVDEKKVHPSIPAEIPGVSLESDFEPILDTIVEEEPSASDKQVAADALDNTGLSQTGTDVARGVIDVDVPTVEDVTDDSDDKEEEEAPPLLVPKDEDDSDSDTDDEDEDKYPEALTGALKYLKDYTVPDSYTDSDDDNDETSPPPSPPKGKGLCSTVQPDVYNPTTGKAYPQYR
jgi:hypothetical protein